MRFLRGGILYLHALQVVLADARSISEDVPMSRKMLTLQEAAKFLRGGQAILKSMAIDGYIPCFHGPKNKLYFAEHDLRMWVERGGYFETEPGTFYHIMRMDRIANPRFYAPPKPKPTKLKRRATPMPGSKNWHKRRCSTRGIFYSALKRGRSNSGVFGVLGYTLNDLQAHLERRFIEGMTWSNYGPVWHLDHIRPLSSFKIEYIGCPEFQKAWALRNLQPLWAEDNIRKGARWTPEEEAA